MRLVAIDGREDHLDRLQDIPPSVFAYGKDLLGLLDYDLRLKRRTVGAICDQISKKPLATLDIQASFLQFSLMGVCLTHGFGSTSFQKGFHSIPL